MMPLDAAEDAIPDSGDSSVPRDAAIDSSSGGRADATTDSTTADAASDVSASGDAHDGGRRMRKLLRIAA
jgi:hypothetical protein